MQAQPYTPALEGARAISCHRFPGRGSAQSCGNIQPLMGLQGQSLKSVALTCSINEYTAVPSVRSEGIEERHALHGQREGPIRGKPSLASVPAAPQQTPMAGGAGPARPGRCSGGRGCQHLPCRWRPRRQLASPAPSCSPALRSPAPSHPRAV